MKNMKTEIRTHRAGEPTESYSLLVYRTKDGVDRITNVHVSKDYSYLRRLQKEYTR